MLDLRELPLKPGFKLSEPEGWQGLGLKVLRFSGLGVGGLEV